MFNPDLGHLLLLRMERHQVNRKGAAQFIKHLFKMFYGSTDISLKRLLMHMLATMIKEAVIVLITQLFFLMTQLCKLNVVSLSLGGGRE